MTTYDLVRSNDTPVLKEFDTGLSKCRAAAVLPDAPIAVISDLDQLAVVDLRSGAISVFPLAGEWGTKSIVGLTDRRILVVSILDVFVYELTRDKLKTSRSWQIKSDGSVLDVAATADGSRVVVAAGDRHYDGGIQKLRPKTLLTGTGLDCLAIGMTPDGGVIAAGRNDGVDVYTGLPPVAGRELRFDNEENVPVLAVGVAPDGRHALVGDDITRVALFDVDSGYCTPLDSHGKAIAVRWSPDGSVAATIVLTREVVMYDPTGDPVACLVHADSGRNYFVGGGWAPGAQQFVVGTEHGRILVWDFATPRPTQD
ncbi:WD40 repeat domain-containing protein [Embleya sp. NPDC001921]